MAYAMPLVDDSLTGMERYLWLGSLDTASGFWAVLMTRRARQIWAFVCALGHFEWLRMPFGLKNAHMIYQRIIDNPLWEYVQPKGGWESFDQRMMNTEEESSTRRKVLTELGDLQPSRLTKFEADRRAQTKSDPSPSACQRAQWRHIR
ncbi:hypothetical protein PC128_g16383 [Phytophthora cactorum]|nr:hypothetical protein PC128_g16383 [Phytophthora cactorum]